MFSTISSRVTAMLVAFTVLLGGLTLASQLF